MIYSGIDMISINLEREPSSYGMSSWRDLDQAPDHIFGSCIIWQVLKSYWRHRDHPDSPASAASTYNTSSQSERIAAAARRSLTRAEYFSRRVLDASSSGNFDSPVEAVVVGGEYAMAVSVGTPPQHFIVYVDTGSDLVWLNCKPCIQCIVQPADNPFDPTQSTSYQEASCTDAACTVLCKIPFSGQFLNLNHSQNSWRVLKELVADLRLHSTYPTGLNSLLCCCLFVSGISKSTHMCRHGSLWLLLRIRRRNSNQRYCSIWDVHLHALRRILLSYRTYHVWMWSKWNPQWIPRNWRTCGSRSRQFLSA